MSSTELDNLIKMANQIADNIAIGDNQSVMATKAAEHIRSFWARPMKDKIIEYATRDGEQLNSVARVAILTEVIRS